MNKEISRRNFLRLGAGALTAAALSSVDVAPSPTNATPVREAFFLRNPASLINYDKATAFASAIEKCITRLTVRSHSRKETPDQKITGVVIEAFNTTTGQRVRFETVEEQAYRADGNYQANTVVQGTSDRSGLLYGDAVGERFCAEDKCKIENPDRPKIATTKIGLQEVGGNGGISYIDADCPDDRVCDKWDNWNVEQQRKEAATPVPVVPTVTPTIIPTTTPTTPTCVNSGQALERCEPGV